MQSISNVQQPLVSHFFATKQFMQIKEDAINNRNLILQCYGPPKAGKSQILLKLTKSFPYMSTGNKELCVKWQLDCHGSRDDIEIQLKSLTKEMCNHKLLNEEVYQKLEDTDDNVVSTLVEALCCSKAHILILIDYFGTSIGAKQQDEKSTAFVRKFLYEMGREAVKTKEQNTKIHIYIATQERSSIFSQDEYSEIKCYKLFHVEGFQKDEGMDFLLNEDNSAVSQLFDKCNGCPVDLHFAKTYCKSKRLCYSTYWEDHVKQDPKRAFSIYFRDDEITWKLLSCLSFLDHRNIPKFVFETLCQTFSSLKQAEKIIDEFMNLGLCSLNNEKDITFHKDVLQAIQEDQYTNSAIKSFCPIREITSIFSSLITKDLRPQEVYIGMLKLIPHGKALLENIEKRSKWLKGRDSVVLRMTISHLYETFGVILCNDPASHDLCDKYFTKALQIIWKDEKLSLLKKPSHSKRNVTTIAKTVAKDCEEAGRELRTNVIAQYEANVLNRSDENEKKFLEHALQPDREKVEQFRMADKLTSYEFIQQLREWNLFLSENEHRKIFFAERLASILHSWSRVYLYKDRPDSKALQLYKWRSDLAQKICERCRNQYHIHLLTENIIATSGVVPITLKCKTRQLADLSKAKELCEDSLSAEESSDNDIKIYEHGLVKELYDSTKPVKQLSLLVSVVRINSRLPVSEEDEQKFDEKCDELLKLARKELKNLSNSWSGFIYCAKYYAKRKKFFLAVLCYEDYFKACSRNKIPHKGHSWAIYNYARTVDDGNLHKEISRAIAKCKEVLKSNEDSTTDLTVKIRDLLGKLKAIQIPDNS